MKKIFILFLFLTVLSTSFAQDASYSFKGQLDQEAIQKLEINTSKLSNVSKAKVRYKEDSQRGEILLFITIDKGQRKEGSSSFKASDLKKLLISNGLNPIEYRSLKK